MLHNAQIITLSFTNLQPQMKYHIVGEMYALQLILLAYEKVKK